MVTSNCKNNTCSNCGECCSPAPIPITKKEYETIKNFVVKNNIKQTPPTQIEGSVRLECCFRDVENKKCKIYDVRPEMCRRFKCDNSEEKINKDKLEIHSSAYYNKVNNNDDMKNITNFDVLFYNDVEPLLQYLNYHLSNETNDRDKVGTALFDLIIINGAKENKKAMDKREREMSRK